MECRYSFISAVFIFLVIYYKVDTSMDELGKIFIKFKIFKISRTFMAPNIGDVDNRILSLMIHN